MRLLVFRNLGHELWIELIWSAKHKFVLRDLATAVFQSFCNVFNSKVNKQSGGENITP